MDTFKNFLISAIRTAVPFVVGYVTTLLATKHIALNDDSVKVLTLATEGLFGMAYYLFVRAAEHINYRFGWLLGYAKMPTYTVSPSTQLPGMVGHYPDLGVGQNAGSTVQPQGDTPAA